MRDAGASEVALILDVVDYAEEGLDEEECDDDDAEDGVGVVEQLYHSISNHPNKNDEQARTAVASYRSEREISQGKDTIPYLIPSPTSTHIRTRRAPAKRTPAKRRITATKGSITFAKGRTTYIAPHLCQFDSQSKAA